ncbi:restriction endonuclease subunit S [Ectopseudomonas oleovorans]|jgi:type I restriction enzyme S subunit|uniref:restriction endonuclease subunit S n=1 Tax=Ectopseudomonas oleovorans TaxID=301 RepID=UPI0035B176DB
MSHYKPYPSYKDSGVEWLGRVPEHWSVVRMRYAATLNPPVRRDLLEDPDQEVSFLPMEAIGEDGSLNLEQNRPVVEVRSGYSYFEDGDVAFAKVTPCFENGKGALMRGLRCAAGFGTTELTVLRPNLAVADARYINYIVQGSSFRAFGAGAMTGAGGLKRVPDEFTRNFPVSLPELGEQRVIASRLDRETARIDALIEKKTRFIELLREKRQALITHAVTKGLDPNAKMKDSGEEWLGEVPEHWVIKRFRDICISISTGPFGTALGNEDYVTGGVPVINPSHIVDEQCSPDPDITVSVETAERLSFWAMRVGDLVTARRGELGRAAVIFDQQDGWICGTGSLRVRPNPNQVLTGYLHTVLQSRYAREWLNLASVGATMANLNEGILGSLPLALPPSTAEQERLLSSLATHSERLIRIEQKAALSVALLKERRSALITAAVTGQIDLREVV